MREPCTLTMFDADSCVGAVASGSRLATHGVRFALASQMLRYPAKMKNNESSFAQIDLADLQAIVGGFDGESPFAMKTRLQLRFNEIKAAKAAGTWVSPLPRYLLD